MSLLLIHTGGTIGMVPSPAGLTPQDGLVEQAVRSRLPLGRSLRVETFDPLVDSSQVGPQHWNRLIAMIMAESESGVILTHGTDTMTFTGAALSQALAGIPKRVVLCGSMAPLNQGGDAEANLDLALHAACGDLPQIGDGVWLAFDGQLLDAAGLVKHDSAQASAFRSVPQDPVTPRARRFAEVNVAILTLSPGLPPAMLKAAMDHLDGAVLRVFGSGTMMEDPELLDILRQAVQRGCKIRAVSQCESGGLAPGSYAAGAGLWSTGVENGGAQTPEAALAALWLALS